MEFLKQYEILYKKANTDLVVSKLLLSNFERGNDEIDIEIIMFHLQQSSEKLLKSILSYNKIHFTKTHDLENLLNNINRNNIKIVDDIDILLDLSDYAVEGRYSIFNDDLDDIEKYIKILENLKNFTKEMIK